LHQGRLAEAITEYEQAYLIYSSLGLKDQQNRVESQLTHLRGLAVDRSEEMTAEADADWSAI
jgi:hypothetical protein